MKSGYSALVPLVGAPFLPLTFLARLPLAMLTIGSMTLVTATTGSYALGGLAAAMVGLGSAVGGPSIGYLADRFGQPPHPGRRRLDPQHLAGFADPFGK